MMDIDLKWLLPFVLPFVFYFWPLAFFGAVGIELIDAARIMIAFVAFVLGAFFGIGLVLINLYDKTITIRKIMGGK